MNKNDLCPGSKNTVWKPAGKHQVSYFKIMWSNLRPSGVKRTKVVCPVCKRKIVPSVQYCHDGCCIIFSIPPHKKKHWWKHKK